MISASTTIFSSVKMMISVVETIFSGTEIIFSVPGTTSFATDKIFSVLEKSVGEAPAVLFHKQPAT